MRESVEGTHRHDGETFHLRGWPSPVPTRTAIVVQHGLGEHGGRYATFARHLDDASSTSGPFPAHLWTYDQRGHGESTGKRGDAAGLEGLAADLEALLPVLVERSGADRVVLYGHSMGGAAAGWYLTTRTSHPAVATVMLSAPPLFIAKTAAIRVKIAVGRLLARVAPSTTLGNEIPVTGISSDPSEVERYRTDPLVHDRLSARLGLSLLDDAPRIVERAAKITLPTLLWHGLDDPIVDVRGTRALYAGLGTDDKTLIELPGHRHECHHETPERVPSLFERIRSWLDLRLAAPSERRAVP
jgi:alpha-beta hydrolase superfamily lysophospholipase